MFPLFLIGGVALLLALSARNASASVVALPGATVPDSVSLKPFEDLPPSVEGSPHRTTETGVSGSRYVADQYPPDAQNRTFHVVQLETPGFPASIEPYAAWLAYWNDRATGDRSLYRAYGGPGDEASSQAVVDIMASDFAVPLV